MAGILDRTIAVRRVFGQDLSPPPQVARGCFDSKTGRAAQYFAGRAEAGRA